jgi:hypothetical protein
MAGEINLTVSADIGDLRRQLESIPGITAEQARLMVAELDRGYKRAEKAAAAAAKATRASMKQAEEATRKASEASKELGDRFGHVGSGAGKLAGALDLLAPGLGSVGQGIADIADVGEVAAGSLGSFAAPAVGALAAAALLAVPVIMHLNAEMEADAEAARVMGTAHAYVRQELELQRTATLDLAVATGSMTEAARTEADIRAQSGQRLGDYLETLTKTTQETLLAENKVRAIANTMGDLATAGLSVVGPLLLVAEAMGAQVPTVSDLTSKLTDYMGLTGKVAKAEQNAATAHTVATEAAKKTRDAQIRASQAKATHVAASMKLTKALKEETVQMDALEAAQRTIEQARTAELTESQKLTEQLGKLKQERIDLSAAGTLTGSDAEKYAAAEIALAQQVADARIEEELRAVTAIQAYEDAARAEQDEAEKIRKEKEREALNYKLAAIQQVTDVIAEYTQSQLDDEVTAYEQAQAARAALGRNATDAEKKLADERLAATRAAARKAFLIDKAAKMASAAAATALAVVQALSSAPPPFNYIAAGAVGAAGLVQQGVIMAQQPTFHAGGFVGGGMAPDEQQATVRRGEAVLSPVGRRAMGDDTIRAANAGMGSGQTIMVQQVYRHRVFDSFVSDNLRTRGPLSRALGAGARAGQRRS